jgi:predicted deacetylase
MYFCIRDDDTSYFTSPEELESAYGEISRLGPVSLAVVPFCRAGSSKGVPAAHRMRWSVHPLHENGPLVDYLREGMSQGRFEVMLHGYNHDVPDALPEFVGGENLRQKVADGRHYLEDVLGTTVKVFVPPHNAIGRRGLQAIAEEGLHLAGTAGVRAGWPLLSRKTWRTWRRLRRWRRTGAVGVPWTLDLGDHREIPGVSITPASSFHQNETMLKEALAKGAVFCAATHYWELEAPSLHASDCRVGEHLRRLVDRAMDDPRLVWRTVGGVVTEDCVSL